MAHITLPPDDDKNKSPKMGQFNNGVTGSILGFIILAGIMGIMLTWAGSFWGWLFLVASVVTWFVGETDLPENPPTAGALYRWKRPIKNARGKVLVVGGKTLTFDFFPFYLSVVKVDMTNVPHVITVEVTALTGAPLIAKVSLVARPNEYDLLDYIQAGASMAKAFAQMDGIVKTRLQTLVGEESDEDLVAKGEVVERIGNTLRKHIDSSRFGVYIITFNLDFDQTQEVKDAQAAIQMEEYQARAEEKDTETYLKLAKKLQTEFASDPHRREVPTLEQCLRMAMGTMRAGRAGQLSATVVDQENGGGNRRGRNRRNNPVVTVVGTQPRT